MADEIQIRTAREHADYQACVLLQKRVYGLSELEIVSALQLISMTYAGGILHLAEDAQGEKVGFAFAAPALRDGVPHFHSEVLAVLPEHQKHGLGLRLKWAQREEALRRGASLVTWTFDPLQARQGHLNLRRLGGVATAFLENFYGLTTAALFHGLPTDRLLVRWELNAPHVQELARGQELSATVETPDLPRINEAKWQSGWTVSSDPDLSLEAPALLLEVPPDWDVLCSAAPRVAQGWHERVRAAFQAYMGRGYVAAGFAPTDENGRRRPFYVLRRG